MSALKKIGRPAKKTMVIEPFADIPMISEEFVEDS